jgi:hypothetical protein
MIERRTLRKHAQTVRPRLSVRIATGWLRLRMIAVLALLPFALRVLPVSRIVALLTPERAPHEPRPVLLYSCAWWVDRLVDRWPFRFWGHCLRRSLALYFVAMRSGYPVVIALGIRRDGGRSVIGHGWLELEGEPFLEPGEHPEMRFVVMQRLPAGKPGRCPA